MAGWIHENPFISSDISTDSLWSMGMVTGPELPVRVVSFFFMFSLTTPLDFSADCPYAWTKNPETNRMVIILILFFMTLRFIG
jgi:hypothetical protein